MIIACSPEENNILTIENQSILQAQFVRSGILYIYFFALIYLIVQKVEFIFPDIVMGNGGTAAQTICADEKRDEKFCGRGYEVCTPQAKYLPP